MSEMEFTHDAFERLLAEHKLMAARCSNCGALYLPPRPLCPACYGEKMAWTPLGGKGVLAAFTTVHIAPTEMIAAGYGRHNPYCAGIVQLEEGPSISAQILGVDAGRPQDIAIGSPLKAAFLERGEGEARRAFLAFEPV